MPQRGGKDLHLWSIERPEAPVHVFQAHREHVTEFLWRTGDDRNFQLLSWSSKERMLRLWPLEQRQYQAVSYSAREPIVRYSRPSRSYRMPPTPTRTQPALNELIAPPMLVVEKPTISSEGANLMPKCSIILRSHSAQQTVKRPELVQSPLRGRLTEPTSDFEHDDDSVFGDIMPVISTLDIWGSPCETQILSPRPSKVASMLIGPELAEAVKREGEFINKEKTEGYVMEQEINTVKCKYPNVRFESVKFTL